MTRSLVYDLVCQNPGITDTEVCQRLGITKTAIEYHLYQLMREGSITRKKKGRCNHSFQTHSTPPAKASIIMATNNPVRARIYEYIKANPGCISKDISKAMNLRPASVTNHTYILWHALAITRHNVGRTVQHYAA